MRVTTTSQYTGQMINIEKQYTRVQDLQEQISTGKKIKVASDEPLLAERIGALTASINSIKLYGVNVNLADNRAKNADIAVTGGLSLLENANNLILRGQNDVLSDDERQALAMNLQGILGSLLAIANQRDEDNEYVFSGMNVTDAPFVETGSGYAYQGSQNPTTIAIANGLNVTYNDAGNAIFGNIPTGTGSTTVFDVLTSAIHILNTPIVAAGDSAAMHQVLNEQMSLLTRGSTNMTNYLTGLGNRESQIRDQTEINAQYLADQEIYLGQLADTDMPAAATELTQRLTILDIMQQSYLKIQQTLSHLLSL